MFAEPRALRQPVPGVGSPGVGGGWDEQRGKDEDGEDVCLPFGDGNAPWGARRGSVFLVPVCSSPFFVASVLCPFVTVCKLWSGVRPIASAYSLMKVRSWPHICEWGACVLPQAVELRSLFCFRRPNGVCVSPLK